MTDMTKGKPLQLILRFALPLIAGNVFQQLYNMADAVIVGRCISADALAAVGTAGTITWLMNAIMMGFSMGAGIVVAQNFGKGNALGLQRAVAAMSVILAIMNLLLSAFAFGYSVWLMRWLKVPENILPDAAGYLRICAVFQVGVAVYNGASATLRSMGDSRTPLFSILAASFVNVFFNLLFVLEFHMGVAGVAYGTVIAQAVSGCICLMRLYRHRKELGLAQMRFRPEVDMLKKVLGAGAPTALQLSLISLGGVCVQGLVNSFGVSVMAAYAATQKIESVAIQVIASTGNALSVFTGQNIGSRDYGRIRKGLRSTLFIMMIAGGALGLAYLLFSNHLLLLFLDAEGGAEALNIGKQIMRIMSCAFLIAGVMNSYLNVIRGAGDVNASFTAGILEITGRIVLAYLLVRPFGEVGIWAATPLSWGCGCVYSVCRYYSGKWKQKSFV